MADTPVEEMLADLIAAGWTRQSATVWRAPDGGLFRGPFGAWKVMNAMRIGRKKAR